MNRRPITGWHATIGLVAFFGVVIAVNIVMAVFATSTFGGTVVDNSYVASQNYNGWLEEARREAEMGWSQEIAREGDRIAMTVATSVGPLENAAITGTATHPLGRTEPIALSFAEIGEGRYRSREPLPEGRWIVRLEIAQGARHKNVLVDLS